MASYSAVSLPELVIAQQIFLKHRTKGINRRANCLRRRRAERRAVLVILLAGILIQLVQTRLPRRLWTCERSAHLWDHIHVVLETFTDTDWLENFRVSQATCTFLYIYIYVMN